MKTRLFILKKWVLSPYFISEDLSFFVLQFIEIDMDPSPPLSPLRNVPDNMHNNNYLKSNYKYKKKLNRL